MLRSQVLEALCAAYWYPLYAFLRRSGRGVEDAQDLTQEFFARLLDGRLLAGADPAKGKFRTLLLCAMQHMDANFYEAARAQKRGGGLTVPLEDSHAEELWLQDAAAEGTPEMAFDRAWADTVMDRATLRLRAEYADRTALFGELFPRLSSGGAEDGLSAVAARLDMSGPAVKMSLSRMRRCMGDCLRAEIAETVGTRGDVEDELRYLLRSFL